MALGQCRLRVWYDKSPTAWFNWFFVSRTAMKRLMSGTGWTQIHVAVGAPEAIAAAYALESSCYAHAGNKSALLTEAHRLLRPGGRLAVADGFLLRAPARRGLQRSIYRRLCECWVIDTLGELEPFTAELARLGFRDIEVEHLQYRVAPSVFHVPWVTLRFLLGDVLFGPRKMTRARWNNVLAPVLLPFVSHPIGPMSYCLITATKAG